MLSKRYPHDYNAENDSDNRILNRQILTGYRNPYHVKKKAAYTAIKYNGLPKRAEAQQ